MEDKKKRKTKTKKKVIETIPCSDIIIEEDIEEDVEEDKKKKEMQEKFLEEELNAIIEDLKQNNEKINNENAHQRQVIYRP